MGPYQEIVALAAAPAPAAVNGFNHQALAVALQTNGDRKEATMLQTGKARMSGLHIGGVIDMKTGNIATLFLPQLTAAHEEYCSKTTKEEKGAAMKRLLDSNNKARPVGDPIISHRDM